MKIVPLNFSQGLSYPTNQIINVVPKKYQFKVLNQNPPTINLNRNFLKVEPIMASNVDQFEQQYQYSNYSQQRTLEAKIRKPSAKLTMIDTINSKVARMQAINNRHAKVREIPRRFYIFLFILFLGIVGAFTFLLQTVIAARNNPTKINVCCLMFH
jgi:hypothetical protein